MGPKPGSEGLPYKNAEDVIGGAPDNQPEPGLNPAHEIKGTPTVKAPKGS